jgi:hypothetical protein
VTVDTSDRELDFEIESGGSAELEAEEEEAQRSAVSVAGSKK